MNLNQCIACGMPAPNMAMSQMPWCNIHLLWWMDVSHINRHNLPRMLDYNLRLYPLHPATK